MVKVMCVQKCVNAITAQISMAHLFPVYLVAASLVVSIPMQLIARMYVWGISAQTISCRSLANVVCSCPAANDVALILEFQTALHEGQTPVTRAWCRVSVFNEAGWIMAGCWRLPLASPPVDLLPRAPATFSQQVLLLFF